MTVSAKRLSDGPIIRANMDGRMGTNINGPSLIECPHWVPDPLGVYYLYFADHRGTYLRLAYAEDVKGPWHTYEPGVLDVAQSSFVTETQLDGEFDYPHVASPDVHVMSKTGEVRMYYHGLCENGDQRTAVAVSTNGINFSARSEIVAPPYLRAFQYEGGWYGIAMPGVLMRSPDGLQPFEACGELLPKSTRHCAVLVQGSALHVVWSQVGEAPERLYYDRVDLSQDVSSWRMSGVQEILRPIEPWEGSQAALVPSAYGAVDDVVNQLRDPYLYEGGGQIYLLYCGGGEAGIGLTSLDV